jgi:hypothetical protein
MGYCELLLDGESLGTSIKSVYLHYLTQLTRNLNTSPHVIRGNISANRQGKAR